jgi:hypothetical protein
MSADDLPKLEAFIACDELSSALQDFRKVIKEAETFNRASFTATWEEIDKRGWESLHKLNLALDALVYELEE